MAGGQTLTFQKLTLRKFPKVTEARNITEEKYWNKYKVALTLKESSSVSHVHFSPAPPYNYAVTSGVKVQVYSPYDNEVLKTFTQFKETAYHGRFRYDGKLLVTGGEEGIVQVFDMEMRTALRQLKKHTKAVHCVDFTTDGYNVISGSDDCSLVHWDMAQEEPLSTFTGHHDYVRCCAAHPVSKSLFISGSYDHTLRLWDVHTKDCVAVMDHGAPVECVLPFRNGASVVSSGGNVVKVWDLLGSHQPIATFSNHQKTILSLCFDGQQQRLLSGGLDKQVKVYSLENYSVLHHLTYAAPITCVAMSPNDSHLVVGMTERVLSIKHKPKTPTEEEDFKTDGEDFLFLKPSQRRSSRRRTVDPQEHEDVVIPNPKKKKLKKHDILLRGFEYRKTLDDALSPRHHGNALLAYSVIQELIRRDGLRIALSRRTEDELLPVVEFLVKHICNPLYTSLLVDVCDLVIEMYGSHVKKGSKIETLFKVMKTKVEVEMKLQRDLLEIKGILGTLATMSTNDRSTDVA